MGEVFVVTSGKGGVGKTTTTANLGTGLAALGYKVVVVDTDIGLRKLDLVMGLGNRIVYDIVDVTSGRHPLKKALIKDKRFEGLYLLPAAQTKDKTSVNAGQMKKLCEELKKQFDYVFIDCPAGIEQGFKNAIAGAEQAIVVTNPEVSAVRDADRIIGLLESNGFSKPRLIINRIRPQMVKQGEMLGIEDLLDLLGIELLGIIPEDDNILISTNKGDPAVLDMQSRAGQAYRNIARRLLGEAVPFLAMEKPRGLLRRVKRLMGFK